MLQNCKNEYTRVKVKKFCVFVSLIVVYLTSLECFKGPRVPKKTPNLHTNELNTTFFCSTSPLKAPNRLKPLKLA
jgi:hypothetical protein